MVSEARELAINDNAYDEENDQKDKFLTFHLAAEDYGIEIQFVTEIVGIQKITNVPDMPDFIRGVINLRGTVIPVMDVRTRFHMPFREYDDRTCIIVVEIKGASIGLVVDEVREVAIIAEDQIEHPPTTGKSGGSRYIKGMGKIDEEIKIILKVDQLFYEEEFKQITGVVGPSNEKTQSKGI